MQQFKQSLTSVPEEMLLEVISMLGLQQYYLYTAGMKQFASFNSFQSKQFNAEMKGMLKTLDRLLGLFEQALPQNVNKTDGLTGIDIGDLKDILEKDYKERQEFLKGLLREAEEKMSGQNK